MHDLVISGGLLVRSDTTLRLDIGVTAGKIAELGENLPGHQIIDADGMLVLPGAIDPHVHLEMPTPVATSSDNWFTGTCAAACGGTTTVIDFVEAVPGERLMDAFVSRKILAENQAVIDFGLHMTINRVDRGTLKEIPEIVSSGLPSFKCYTTYAMALDDAQLLTALEKIREAGGLTIVHSENDAMIKHLRKKYIQAGKTAPKYHPVSRPPAAEGEAIERVLSLAEVTKAPVYIVHVSTQRGAEAIARAQERGQAAFGETCPQYLVLSDTCFDAPGFEGAKYICSPPLRKETDQEALWQALNQGIIQTVGTDHCPFFYKGTKDLGRTLDNLPPFTDIPGGIPGIESRLALIYTYGVQMGRISLNQWVDVVSTGPAQMFGLYPRKGGLVVGADADIVIFDPEKRVTLSVDMLHENVDYTPYESFKLEGYPIITLANGRIIVQDMEFVGDEIHGKFLPGNPFLANQ